LPEDGSGPEQLADENEEPGRLADRGFKTGRDANIVKTLRREPAARKLIPFPAMVPYGGARLPTSRACSAVVPTAGSDGASLSEGTQGGTPGETAGEDARATEIAN